MRRAAALVIVSGAALAAAWWFVRSRASDDDAGYWGQDVVDTFVDTVDEGFFMVSGYSLRNWETVAARPENAAYVTALHRAESANSIPRGMLVRLAYQESRFRPDIISGATISSAGAIGIMQIVPRWHPDVDPYDPFASIAYAGRYLARLYRKFGNWEHALQAYNWGEGNLAKYLAGTITSLPLETRNYSSQILADLGATATGGVLV